MLYRHPRLNFFCVKDTLFGQFILGLVHWPWATIISVLCAIITVIVGPIRSAKNEIRAQAETISAWDRDINAKRIPKEPTDVVINNGSQSPIYDVVVSFGVAAGAGPAYLTGDNATTIGTVPPGRWIGKAPAPEHGMYVQPNVAIAFRDANDRSWCRDAKGQLAKIDDPYAYMKINLPQSFEGVTKEGS